MQDVSELKKIFKAVGLAAGNVKKIAADKKVNFSDLGHMFSLASGLVVELSTLAYAEIPLEAKDLNEAEVKELVEALFEGLKG